MSYSIREMRKEEYSLLSDFLYEAIYIPDGTAAPPKSVITCPELQVYIADFGNSKHDKALIVEVDGNIVGAIWARIMNDYGHIDENTPSLAMSVLKAYRGMGIGTLLLTQMLLAEKAAGYAKISLSVQKDNYAVKLYRKAGFTTVKETTEEYIMVADLNSICKMEELLYLYGSSADTVIEQHIKFQASFPADLDQIGHIRGLEESDHWIGRFHPKRIRRSPCRIFGINFFWHTNLRLLRFPDWVAHDRFQSAHIAFSRIAQIDFVMVSCIRNIQFVSIRFHIVVH